MKLICLAFVLTAGFGFAQVDKPVEEPHFYRLDFVMKELDGAKTVNSRAYAMTISTDKGSQSSSMRTGSKVPLPTSGNGSSFSYSDLGINIDCRNAKVLRDELALFVSVEVTSVPEAATAPVVIRTNKWSGNLIVALRRPTVIFSSDDVMSKKQMQLELTATLIN